MKTFLACLRKELLEQLRTGRLTLLGILFLLFGIMNPAVAKLTPWLLEMMADSLAESGMTVTSVTVTAMDSWVQFFKNIPMALIAFVLLESSIFTREYETGTLVLLLTKGLKRHQVVISKAVVLAGLWTLGYWLCFDITYGYNAYFWDNSVAQNLALSVISWWVFGLWVVGLMVFFSVLARSNTGVLAGTGGVVLAYSVLGFLPKVKSYVPTFLSDGNSLIYGTAEASAYGAPLLIALAITAVCFVGSIPLFNKRQL